MARIRLAASFRFIKYSMFFFNLLFWIFGIIIFMIGCFLSVSSVFSVFTNHHTGAYIFIIVGIIMIVTGFLGCCGAIRESPCLLIFFFIILFFIFILLMLAGLWSVAYKGKINKKFENYLVEKVSKYKQKQADRDLIDTFQRTFECCGVFTPSDYTTDYPLSCGETMADALKKKGCHPKLVEFIERNLDIVIGIGIFVAIILLVGMTFSITLACAIREAEKLSNK